MFSDPGQLTQYYCILLGNGESGKQTQVLQDFVSPECLTILETYNIFCPLAALFLLLYFIISVSVHVCVYDVGCFVDVLASRSGYSVRKPSVPMIAILLAPQWVCRQRD